MQNLCSVMFQFGLSFLYILHTSTCNFMMENAWFPNEQYVRYNNKVRFKRKKKDLTKKKNGRSNLAHKKGPSLLLNHHFTAQPILDTLMDRPTLQRTTNRKIELWSSPALAQILWQSACRTVQQNFVFWKKKRNSTVQHRSWKPGITCLCPPCIRYSDRSVQTPNLQVHDRSQGIRWPLLYPAGTCHWH